MTESPLRTGNALSLGAVSDAGTALMAPAH